MKVKVTFELDLTENRTLNIQDKDDISPGLQELSSFFHCLHLHNLERKLHYLARSKNDDEITKKMILMHYEQDVKVSEQLFHNHTVEGVTEDGNHFVFTHQEPGYQETLIVNGEKVE